MSGADLTLVDDALERRSCSAAGWKAIQFASLNDLTLLVSN